MPSGQTGGGQWWTSEGDGNGNGGDDGDGHVDGATSDGNVGVLVAQADIGIANDGTEVAAGPTAPGKTDGVDWNFIAQQEGTSLDGYTVKGRDGLPSASSGVTVATGVDLGSMNQGDLDRLGLSDELEAKLEPYLGLKGSDAQEALDSDPLTLTPDEADALTEAVTTHNLSALRDQYNGAVGPNGVQFDDMPPEAQTAIVDVAMQWGPTFGGPNNSYARNFWQAAIAQNWAAAESVLREWASQSYKGTDFENRRNAEADLLGRIR